MATKLFWVFKISCDVFRYQWTSKKLGNCLHWDIPKTRLPFLRHFSLFMMTSWNESVFRVTGPSWGESTGQTDGFPAQKGSNVGFAVFFNVSLNKQSNKQSSADDSRGHDAHCDITSMASFRTLLGVVYSDDYGFIFKHVVNDVDTDNTTSTYVSYQITKPIRKYTAYWEWRHNAQNHKLCGFFIMIELRMGAFCDLCERLIGCPPRGLLFTRPKKSYLRFKTV